MPVSSPNGPGSRPNETQGSKMTLSAQFHGNNEGVGFAGDGFHGPEALGLPQVSDQVLGSDCVLRVFSSIGRRYLESRWRKKRGRRRRSRTSVQLCITSIGGLDSIT